MSLYNTIAETYDANRPDYPASMIVDIVEAGNLSETSKLMEIGAGTGKATTDFLSRGFSIAIPAVIAGTLESQPQRR